MYVQPVSLLNKTPNYSYSLSSKKSVLPSQKPDTVSFTSYEKALKNMVVSPLNRESKVENYFKILMSTILDDSSIEKMPMFSTIHSVYREKGLRGMLMEFWKAYPEKQFEHVVEDCEMGTAIILASKKITDDIQEPVIKLVNWGRHGFWNNVFNRKNAPHDIRLIFSNKETSHGYDFAEELVNKEENLSKLFSVELYLDKVGDVTVEQQYGERSLITHFYSLTGHKKLTVDSFSECKPDVTYFHKNGTKNFWKNFFIGGTPVEPIF